MVLRSCIELNESQVIFDIVSGRREYHGKQTLCDKTRSVTDGHSRNVDHHPLDELVVTLKYRLACTDKFL